MSIGQTAFFFLAMGVVGILAFIQGKRDGRLEHLEELRATKEWYHKMWSRTDAERLRAEKAEEDLREVLHVLKARQTTVHHVDGEFVATSTRPTSSGACISAPETQRSRR